MNFTKKVNVNTPKVNPSILDSSTEIALGQREVPFTLLPKATFRIRRSEKQRYSLFRLLLLLSYLYSLSMTNERKAFTSVRELMKVLSTNSYEGVIELLNVLERNNIIVARNYDPKKKRTEITLANYTEIPEIATTWDDRKVIRDDLYFKFPKLITILPITPQAKAIYLCLCALRKKAKDWTVTTSVSEIQKVLNLYRKSVITSLRELEEKGLIKLLERGKHGSTYEIVRPVADGELLWSEELLQATFHSFPSHPFLDYYSAFQYRTDNNDDCSNVEPTPFQYRTDGDDCSNLEPTAFQYRTDNGSDRSNIEPVAFQFRTDETGEELRDTKASALPIKDIKEDSKEVEDFIEDDANINGGVVFENGVGKSSKAGKGREGVAITERNSSNANSKSIGTSLNTRPYGLKENKGGGAPKNEPSEPEGSSASDPCNGRFSEEKLREVERTVLRIAERLPEHVLSRYSYGEDWQGLEKAYSRRVAEFLARAFQFLKNRTGNFSNIRNPVGFLISFVCKDAGADFKEFIGKFLFLSGYKHLLHCKVEEDSRPVSEKFIEEGNRRAKDEKEVEEESELVKVIFNATDVNSLPRGVRQKFNELLRRAVSYGWEDSWAKRCYYVLPKQVVKQLSEEFSAFVELEVRPFRRRKKNGLYGLAELD